jgi:hypothetical protein
MSQSQGFPFVTVTEGQMTFGQISNMTAAIAACPVDFRQGNEPHARAYRDLANDLFAHYAKWRSMTEEQIAEVREVTDMDRYTDERWQYILCWLRSRNPSHQEKEAVVAWCLSLIMREPPPYTLK